MDEGLGEAIHAETGDVVDSERDTCSGGKALHVGGVKPITINGGRGMAVALGVEIRDEGIQGVTIVEVNGCMTITSLTEESREEVKKVLRRKAFQ